MNVSPNAMRSGAHEPGGRSASTNVPAQPRRTHTSITGFRRRDWSASAPAMGASTAVIASATALA